MANNKKSKRKKIIIFSIGGILLIALVLVIVLGSKKVPIIPVQIEDVKKRIITQIVTATGKIYPEIQVIITPEVSGEVISLPVRDGQKVKKNDLLLKIKPDFYTARRDQMAAGVASSGATLQRVQNDYRRIKDLFEKKLVSDAELDQAKTAYEVAKAGYEQAQAALNQTDEDLRKTTIYSPMEGTVTQLKVESGERVLGTSQFQGTAVMTIADLSRMECRVDVGENDIVLISISDTARIDIDAFPNRKFIGVVYEIANTAKTKGFGTQEEVTNFEVKVRIIDKDVILRPGMSMTATIETETHENVIAVPIQCVTTRQPKVGKIEKQEEESSDVKVLSLEKMKQKSETSAKEVVFLSNDDGTAKMIEVKRGISDDLYIEITEGLKEGDKVITGSFKAISRELEDGSKIKTETDKKWK
ncbi:MAG: efflux RND transporter periplasmic adaptor subunit [Bacteroidetes bacterium]|nr:efflux RND transporter periplasmic adaptor subunit [Bacteroidota bacterium]MBU1421885.1 efflux RND transporter periplasmic adaptor subunit [Bacteroidota bacterium]MBU2471321.1 efflux RND transporter periplasmic adaptor subunit [Bacteroidota bacterium]